VEDVKALAAKRRTRMHTITAGIPRVGGDDDEEDDDLEPKSGLITVPKLTAPRTQAVAFDPDAADDEPTLARVKFAVASAAESDPGARRKRNEDAILVSEDHGLFVVADGMGGYRGGELASKLAVATIFEAFESKKFDGPRLDGMPRRASELARALLMANSAILAMAASDKILKGMGTTISAARFVPEKGRLYVAHVGDSRIYRYRRGALRQMTSDHTMKDFGLEGAKAAHLSRAVGVWPSVPIDVVIAKPEPGDAYLLCSDGLTKMVPEDDIEKLLRENEAEVAVGKLIAAANEGGGEDNVSVVLVRVTPPVEASPSL